MQTICRIKQLVWVSIICLFLMSASILFMPLATNYASQTSNISFMIVGGVFWVSLIVGYSLLIRANVLRRWFIRNRTNAETRMSCRMGIISFFSNVPATIADTVMITSFIVISVISFTALKDKYIIYVLLFLLTFSLNMHGVLNGRIYKSTKFKRIRREESHD